VVDPRGLRFAAALTSGVLAVVLVTANVWLLLTQLVVFAIGASAGVRYAPYALVFRYLVGPRIGPPASTEDPTPPRFAQALGEVFATIGVVGFLTGADVVGYAATAAAFCAAFLNAAFSFCLACQFYLIIRTFSLKGAYK
jgi:hypothetical protein